MAASLLEIQTLLNDPDLNNKVRAAVVKTAVSINFEGDAVENHAARIAWAKAAFADPNGTAQKVVRYVVAANAALDLTAIQALTDAQIQSHVDASVGVFA